jgi:hypothetical protein
VVWLGLTTNLGADGVLTTHSHAPGKMELIPGSSLPAQVADSDEVSPPIPSEGSHPFRAKGPTHRSDVTLAAWVTP